MAYKHLTFTQRCRIYGLWRAGHNQTEIAKEIGVHKSTISREFQRNIFWWVAAFLNINLTMPKATRKAGIQINASKLSLMKKLKRLFERSCWKIGVLSKAVAMQNATIFFQSVTSAFINLFWQIRKRVANYISIYTISIRSIVNAMVVRNDKDLSRIVALLTIGQL